MRSRSSGGVCGGSVAWFFCVLGLMNYGGSVKVKSSDLVAEGYGEKFSVDKIFAIPFFHSNFSGSNSADELRKQSLSLADSAICSLYKSQKSQQTILWYPGDQESTVQATKKKFSCPTKLTRVRTLDFPDGLCWVQYKSYGLIDLLVELVHKDNVYLVESDQLFFRDLGVIEDICKECDIGFTFTKKITERNRGKTCVNYGFVYIRKVNENVITFFRNLARYVEDEISSRGCHGGVDQHALCRMLGGYLAPNRRRSMEGDLNIVSLDRKKFNPSSRGGVSCSGKRGEYMSHFVGDRKKKMLSKVCRKEYDKFAQKLKV